MSDTNDSGETQFGRGEASGQPRIIPNSSNEALRPEPVPEPEPVRPDDGLTDAQRWMRDKRRIR